MKPQLPIKLWFHKLNMMAEWRSRKMFDRQRIITICEPYWAVFVFFFFSVVWLACLWTWLVWLLSWEANKADAEQCDQWSSRVHWKGTQGFTKAGLITKGTKTSITFSCLDHGWDPKLGSIKPPTKDWSSEHQSPSNKSSLFQTSGILIQTLPVESCWLETNIPHGGYSDPSSTKTSEVWKASSREGVEKFIHTILHRHARWSSYATV